MHPLTRYVINYVKSLFEWVLPCGSSYQTVLCYVITLFLQTCLVIISIELMVRRSPSCWLVVMAAIKTLWIISLAVHKVNQMIPHLTWQQLLCASCLLFKQNWMESQNYVGIQLSLSSSSWTTFIVWSDLFESKEILTHMHDPCIHHSFHMFVSFT